MSQFWTTLGTIRNVFLLDVGIPIVWSVEHYWISVGIGLVNFAVVVDLEGGVVDSCEFGIVEVWWGGVGVVEVWTVGGDDGGECCCYCWLLFLFG